MSNKCDTVIISDKAYNAIIRESFAKHPVETGGILLGYILDNGLWVVMEMIPPGINGVFRTAYFEYDRDFVNYLGTSVANQYREPLQVLGLWHRHPGSMDFFSQTDDGTNSDFASKNPYGVISGLVNIDPSFRLTMYHLDHIDGMRPRNVAYSKVEVEVGDDLIPGKFFDLRYINSVSRELHPMPTESNRRVANTKEMPQTPKSGAGDNDRPVTDEAVDPTTETDGKRLPASTRWRAVVAGLMIFAMGIAVGTFVVPKVAKWLKSEKAEMTQKNESHED